MRNSSRTIEAGVTVLEGLVGNVTLARHVSRTALTWLPLESSQVSDQSPTFGQIALSPKDAAVVVKVSRQLIKQTGPVAELVSTVLPFLNGESDAKSWAGQVKAQK